MTILKSVAPRLSRCGWLEARRELPGCCGLAPGEEYLWYTPHSGVLWAVGGPHLPEVSSAPLRRSQRAFRGWERSLPSGPRVCSSPGPEAAANDTLLSFPPPLFLPLPVTCPWCTWCGSMTSGTHKRGHFSYLISSISVYPVACGQESSCRCRRLQVQVRSRGREDPLETGMATHSSVLAWRISWTEEPGGLQFIGLQKSWTRLSKVLLFINGESKLFMLRFHLHPYSGISCLIWAFYCRFFNVLLVFCVYLQNFLNSSLWNDLHFHFTLRVLISC